MTNDTLTSTIEPQRQMETATDNHPSVLMDDPNYTMDDASAYMGNPTVNSQELSTTL